jgi:hypothetical protein
MASFTAVRLVQHSVLIGNTDKDQSRSLLIEAVQDDPEYAAAWSLLATFVKTEEERRFCLEQVVRINSSTQDMRYMLRQLPNGPSTAPAGLDIELAQRLVTELASQKMISDEKSKASSTRYTVTSKVSKTAKSRYINHCWNCVETINSEMLIRCNRCNMFICANCGACMCNYASRD